MNVERRKGTGMQPWIEQGSGNSPAAEVVIGAVVAGCSSSTVMEEAGRGLGLFQVKVLSEEAGSGTATSAGEEGPAAAAAEVTTGVGSILALLAALSRVAEAPRPLGTGTPVAAAVAVAVVGGLMMAARPPVGLTLSAAGLAVMAASASASCSQLSSSLQSSVSIIISCFLCATAALRAATAEAAPTTAEGEEPDAAARPAAAAAKLKPLLTVVEAGRTTATVEEGAAEEDAAAAAGLPARPVRVEAEPLTALEPATARAKEVLPELEDCSYRALQEERRGTKMRRLRAGRSTTGPRFPSPQRQHSPLLSLEACC